MQIQFQSLTPSLVLYILWLTSTCSKENDTQNEIYVYPNVNLYNSSYLIMVGHALKGNDAEETCVHCGMKMATVVEEVIAKVEAVIRLCGPNTTFCAWIGYSQDSSRHVAEGLLVCPLEAMCFISRNATASIQSGDCNNNDEHNNLQETLPHAFICEINSDTIWDEKSYKNFFLRRLDCYSYTYTNITNITTENIPIGCSGTPAHEGDHNVTVVQWVCVGLASALVLAFVLLLLLVARKRRNRIDDNGLQASGQSNHLNTFQKGQSSQVSGTKDTETGKASLYVEAYNRAYDAFRSKDDFRYIYQEPELGMESEDVSEVLDVSEMVDLDIANGVNESPNGNSLRVEDQNEIPSRSQDHIYAKVIKTKL